MYTNNSYSSYVALQTAFKLNWKRISISVIAGHGAKESNRLLVETMLKFFI